MILITFLFTLSFARTVKETRKCIIDCADKQIGKPYLLYTEGPNTFDCSGLVMYCYEKCGYEFKIRPHTWELIKMGKSVSKSNLQLADLVFPHSGHVTMYHGNNKIIHAPCKNSHVKINNLYSNIYGIRRLILEDTPDVDYSITNGKRVTVTSSELNARNKPKYSQKSVYTYKKGDTIPFDSAVKDSQGRYWLSYISSSNVRRYVISRNSKQHCNTSPCVIGLNGTATVTANSLNMRDGATLDSNVVKNLKKGTVIKYDIVFKNEGRTWISWLEKNKRRYVSAKGIKGKEYVTPCP